MTRHASVTDIKGAFDELWWPAVFLKLRQEEVSLTIYRIICVYLTELIAFKEHEGYQAPYPSIRVAHNGKLPGVSLPGRNHFEIKKKITIGILDIGIYKLIEAYP
ncbi:hypothetical protein J6590_083527 [Homalodisca vitripennis]|nr:hypothetical protein J6590_083527 [Homalodisca vitripennis]